MVVTKAMEANEKPPHKPFHGRINRLWQQNKQSGMNRQVFFYVQGF